MSATLLTAMTLILGMTATAVLSWLAVIGLSQLIGRLLAPLPRPPKRLRPRQQVPGRRRYGHWMNSGLPHRLHAP